MHTIDASEAVRRSDFLGAAIHNNHVTRTLPAKSVVVLELNAPEAELAEFVQQEGRGDVSSLQYQ